MSAGVAFLPGDRCVIALKHGERHYGTVIAPWTCNGLTQPAYEVQADGGYINTWKVLASDLSVPRAQRDMVIGDLLNLDMLKEVIEVEFIGSLWTEGDSGPMTPYVCEAAFGDGLHLLTLSTINQRPNYHVIRIDSRYAGGRWVKDDELGDHLDEILSAIEEECGRAGRCLDEPCDNCGDCCCTCRPKYNTREDWPAIEADDGCSWGQMRWDWLLKTIGGSASACLPRSWAERYLQRSAA